MKPNWFCNFVTDTKRSTAFYNDLFEMEPVFVAPAFVAYDLGGGVQFALWSSHTESAIDATPRTSEMGLTVAPGAEEIERYWQIWRDKAPVIEELHVAPFGPTFVISDPDGNRIRMSPQD